MKFFHYNLFNRFTNPVNCSNKLLTNFKKIVQETKDLNTKIDQKYKILSKQLENISATQSILQTTIRQNNRIAEKINTFFS